jgi:hypothetical protein
MNGSVCDLFVIRTKLRNRATHIEILNVIYLHD